MSDTSCTIDSLCASVLHFKEPDGGFFEDSPFWHPELGASHVGYACEHVPYMVSTDSPTACVMMLCFVMLAYMLLRYGAEMKSRMHDFFLPARIAQNRHTGLGTAQGLLSMPYVCVILSLMGAVGLSVVMEDSLALLPSAVTRLSVQGFYVAAWLLYFFCKINSYSFINWIFFDKHARREWRDIQFHLLALQAILLYPVLLFMAYQMPPVRVFAWCVFSVILLVKVLILYKTLGLFFHKIHGALHLIVYFCTLEAAPLWVILRILTQITDLLQVK